MGWLKLLLNANKAEGAREAVRLSYRKHLHKAPTQAPDTDPHNAALYGALASRYRLLGRRLTTDEIVPEILPFLMMKEHDSIEALAEYVVYLEKPEKVEMSRLRPEINAALRRMDDLDDNTKLMVLVALQYETEFRETSGLSGHHIVWLDFLDNDVRKSLGLLFSWANQWAREHGGGNLQQLSVNSLNSWKSNLRKNC